MTFFDILYADSVFKNIYLTYIDRALQRIALFPFIVIRFIKHAFVKHIAHISAYYLKKRDSFIFSVHFLMYFRLHFRVLQILCTRGSQL